MKQKEAKLKTDIIEYLKFLGIFCWNNRNVGVYNPKYGKYIPSTVKGVSDIIGILPNGKFLAIEIKVKPNKLTEHQKWFLEQIKKNNGVAIVAYNLTDVIDGIKNYFSQEEQNYDGTSCNI